MSRNSRVLLVLVALLAALLPLGLGSTAYAESCGTLHAADVAYGAPLITGTLDDHQPTSCFLLDLPEATTVLLGTRTSTATITVRSGTTNLGCSGSDSCTLSGNGPFRVDAGRASFSTASLDLRILALTPQAGCPGIIESALGAADSPVSVDLAGRDVTCASVDLTHTRHLVHTTGGGQDLVAADLVAADGTDECFVSRTGVCVTTQTGPHVLGLANREDVPFDEHFRTQLVDLDNVASCPGISGSWFSDPADEPASGPDVACRTLEGATSGDRYAVATGTASASDASNWNILGGGCERSSGLGCTLDGDGPFRVITWGSDDYRVVARRVGPGSDCPTIAITPFGAPAEDYFPGAGCRSVALPASHPIVVLPFDRSTGQLHYQDRLYDSDFNPTCALSSPDPDPAGSTEPCELDESGDLTVITDLFGADTSTYVYDLASTDGCTTPSPTRLRTHETDLAAHELACERVDQPAGAVVTTYQRDGHELSTASSYVDATGAPACDHLVTTNASCRLHGTAPFRVLQGAEGSDLQSVTLTANGLGSCPTTLGEGPSAYEDLPLTAATSLRCLKVPTKQPGTTELVHAYRTGGDGPLLLALHAEDGAQQERATTVDRSLDLTSRSADDFSSVVVLGAPTTVRVARATVAEDEIVNWRRPRIFGDVRAGQTVIPATGQWSSSHGSIHPQNSTWVLDGKVVHQGKNFVIPSSAGGKVLVLRVTAYGLNGETSCTVDSVRYPVGRQ